MFTFAMFFLSVCLVCLISTSASESTSDSYTIPQPKIEAFKRGFRVSIPHERGVTLFAFHGNINRPMDGLEAGQFSRDILKRKGNDWIFEDLDSHLRVGDIVYYWLFVIRNNLGYRYDHGKFVVREMVPFTSIPSHPDEPHRRKPSSDDIPSDAKNTIFTGHNISPRCSDLILNLTRTIVYLSKDLDQLSEENKVLMSIAQKDDYYSTSLRVFGKFATTYYTTPQDQVQNFITEKLGLSVKVMDAKVIPDDGISFRVATLTDKLSVILAANEKLDGSSYEVTY